MLKLGARFLGNGMRIYATKKFVELFMKGKEYTWTLKNSLYIAYWLINTGLYIIFHNPSVNLLVNIIFLIFIVLPYKVNGRKKALVILSIYSISIFGDSISTILLDAFSNRGEVTPLSDCFVAIFLLVAERIAERMIPSNTEIILPIKYEFIFGVIPMAGIIVNVIFYDEWRKEKSLFLCSIFILAVLSFLVFYIYYSLAEFYSAYIERKKLQQMINAYIHQIEVLEESQNKVRALRHDLKHHLLELTSMAQKEQLGEMKKYLANMQEFLLNSEKHSDTGNQQVDGVLNYYLEQAKKSLKTVEIKVLLPEGILTGNFNFCVILGNLLDNAICASKHSKEQYLKVHLQMKGYVIFLFIENSYNGFLKKQKDKYMTTKRDIYEHGIGLQNVKKIVEENNGEIKIVHDKEKFGVYVMMYLLNNRDKS